MDRNRRTIPLGFTQEAVTEGLHICYIYSDETERRQVIAKYLESGLQANEKLLYLVDNMTPKEMLDCLEEIGVEGLTKTTDLTILQAAPAYCPFGTFNADEMLEVVRHFYQRAMAEGCQGARGSGEMSWCLVNDRVDKRALFEYESRLNHLLSEYPYTACCQYDARRFSGQMIMDVLSVHPVAIVRGQLVKNPFYIEPATFLLEYRRRTRGL